VSFEGLRLSRFIYFFLGFILLGVLLALVWAARTHQETVQNIPDILARDFRQLLIGEEISDLDLGEIEKRAELVKSEYPYISEIIVRKMQPNGESRIVYPFFYYVDLIDTPPEDDPTFQFKVLKSDEDDPLGTLYVKISAQRSLLFFTAIMGSIIALILMSGLGVYTIQSKDLEVRKTTSLLEEKQRELIHLERLALVGQVTANLIHDLKKPVLNIRGEAEQIEDDSLKNTILEETELFSSMIRGLQIEGFLRRDQEKRRVRRYRRNH
jgi:signal transduction histidine kinase